MAKKIICDWCDEPIDDLESESQDGVVTQGLPMRSGKFRTEGGKYHAECVDLMRFAQEAYENDES